MKMGGGNRNSLLAMDRFLSDCCGVSSFTRGKKSTLNQCLIDSWVLRGLLWCIPRILWLLQLKLVTHWNKEQWDTWSIAGLLYFLIYWVAQGDDMAEEMLKGLEEEDLFWVWQNPIKSTYLLHASDSSSIKEAPVWSSGKDAGLGTRDYGF